MKWNPKWLWGIAGGFVFLALTVSVLTVLLPPRLDQRLCERLNAAGWKTSRGFIPELDRAFFSFRFPSEWQERLVEIYPVGEKEWGAVSLRGARFLKHLHLKAPFSDKEILDLPRQRFLMSLQLEGEGFGDAFVEFITSDTKMNLISLKETKVTAAGFREMLGMLKGCDLIRINGLDQLAPCLPELFAFADSNTSSLALRNMKVPEGDFPNLTGMSFKYLFFSQMEVSAEWFRGIAHCEDLIIHDCEFGLDDLQIFGQIPELRSLLIEKGSLTKQDVEFLEEKGVAVILR